MTKEWTTTAGRVISEAEAERMAAAFEADDQVIAQAVAQPIRPRGRPRLEGTNGKRSPKVEFRVPESVYARLKQTASRQQRPMSAIAREALEAYVESHQPSS